jgi:hypothetical protein
VTDFDLETLSALAAKVDKRLRWAGFLLAAMLVILAIDLQLKRSLGRQAVETARNMAVMHSIAAAAGRLRADLEGGTGGREPAREDAGRGADPGRAGGHDVDGAPGVAAGAGDPDGPLADAVARHPAGTRKRAPRNGTRASGGTGG